MPRIAGSVRRGHLRCHRRSRAQEADARDLRPGQPGPAAANFALVGFARRDWADEDFGKLVCDAVRQHARTPFRQEVWDRLAEGIRFVQGTFDDDEAFQRLAETLEKLDAERGTGGNHAFYLSIPPNAFQMVLRAACRSPAWPAAEGRWSRVVIEKPFGHDLASAEELNGVVNSVFPEESVFRIDHYLGKETVQNILALRFANELYEPIWNTNYVDSVQITMAEDIGLGGRGGYYDGVGAARDVIQNHLMQLMALTAMEEPVSFSPPSCRPRRSRCCRRPGRWSRWTRPPRAASTPQAGRAARRSSACSRRRDSPRLHHRDLRRDHAGDRYPALGRRAVLPAHRKTPGPQGDRDRIGLQTRPASALRHHDDRGTRQERLGDPGPARRGHHAAFRVQGPGQLDGGPRRQHGLLLRRRRSPRTPPRPTNG